MTPIRYDNPGVKPGYLSRERYDADHARRTATVARGRPRNIAASFDRMGLELLRKRWPLGLHSRFAALFHMFLRLPRFAVFGRFLVTPVRSAIQSFVSVGRHRSIGIR